MLLMIIVGVGVFAFGIGMVWFLVARGREVAAVTHEDFDDAYDELVAKGEVVDRDRDAAWRDFHTWQLANEEERSSWEESGE